MERQNQSAYEVPFQLPAVVPGDSSDWWTNDYQPLHTRAPLPDHALYFARRSRPADRSAPGANPGAANAGTANAGTANAGAANAGAANAGAGSAAAGFAAGAGRGRSGHRGARRLQRPVR